MAVVAQDPKVSSEIYIPAAKPIRQDLGSVIVIVPPGVVSVTGVEPSVPIGSLEESNSLALSLIFLSLCSDCLARDLWRSAKPGPYFLCNLA